MLLKIIKTYELIKNVPNEYINELTVSEDCEIDFDCRNACYIIKSGELLSYGANKFTQLLKTNDPKGVAETILGRSNELKYRRYKKVDLYSLAGDPVRSQINSAGPLAKSIVKYSLRRIFQVSDDDKAPLLFEEKFFLNNEKETSLESLKRAHGFSEVVFQIIECISWKREACNYLQKIIGS